VLKALGNLATGVRPICLRDPLEETEPPIHWPGSAEIPPGHNPNARYQFQGEIARGGMGAVLKGHDLDLGRDVAVKVLLEEHRGNPDALRRFVEEAQIGGQLQHPGIVPVYELGQFPDTRPYFTMKLVKGQTLAKLLADRTDPGDDRPRLLRIFESVCETLAYAHARGVIHRDLKPSNVMVGAFGEVQVMDWGLAKVLPEGGVADEQRPQAGQSVVRTIRSEGSNTPGVAGSQTRAGSVMGTPAYMPPEQALGEVDCLDERCDVFGLGAILCQILTGKPPYVAVGREAVYGKAQQADLAECFARLDACGIDAELLRLTRQCLAAAAKDRPRNAGVLATELARYRESAELRLRQAEIARAEAQARTVEERKRRRVQLALAACLLLTTLLTGGGLFWVAEERATRQQERLARRADTERAVALALGHAEQLQEQAGQVEPATLTAAEQNLALWRQAVAAVEQAEAVVDTGDVGRETRERMSGLRTTLAEGIRAGEASQRLAQLLADLAEARLTRSNAGGGWGYNDEAAATAYERAFSADGMDVRHKPAEELITGLQALPPGPRTAVALALDYWAACAGKGGGHPRSDLAGPSRPDGHGEATAARDFAAKLSRLAAAIDSDPWRQKFRQAKSRAALESLAQEALTRELPAASLSLLVDALERVEAKELALQTVRKAVTLYPADFFGHFQLAELQGGRLAAGDRRPEVLQEAVTHAWAAVAARPQCANAYHLLGFCLEHAGDAEGAAAVRRKAGEVTDAALQPARVWLSNLPEQNAQVGWGSFGKHGWAGFETAPICVFGLASPQGLGLHPDGHVEYVLGKRYRTFRGTAGMDDSAAADPRSARPVDFRVLGDGRLLWESRGLHGRCDAQPCLLDITGVDVLRLEAIYRPGSEGAPGQAHAVWIDPYVAADPPAKDVLALFDPARFKLLEDQEELKHRVRRLFEKEDFAALEEHAGRLRQSDVFCCGVPLLRSYYDELSAPARNTLGPPDAYLLLRNYYDEGVARRYDEQAVQARSDDKAWQQHFARLEHWRKAKADSVTPLVLLGDSYLRYGVQARGYGLAHEVGPAAAKAAGERAEKARGYLEAAAKMKPPDAEVYRALLGVELLQGRDKEQAFRYFERGRAMAPRYFSLYDDLANYLLPSWHGAAGELQQYAAKLRKESGGELGDLIYFHMACVESMHAGDGFFGNGHFKYEDLLPGIRAALRDHPESFYIYNNACHMACLAGDNQLGSKLLTRMDAGTTWIPLWRGYGQLNYWRRQIDPQTYAGEEIKTLAAVINGWVESVAFLKDGRLVSGGEMPGMNFWDPETGRLAAHVATPLPIGMLAVDGAGRQVIVAHGIRDSADTVAVVYSVDGREDPRRLSGHAAGVTSVAFDRAGTRCGTAARDNTARIWDLDSPDKPIVLQHPEWVYDIAFSADGKTVATASYQGGIWLWDGLTGKPLGKPLVEMNQGPWQCRVRFVGDNTLITASVDGTLRRWDLATRTCRQTKPQGGWIYALAVSPDGNWLAVGRQDGRVDLLAAATLELARSYAGHCGSCYCVCFAPDGRTLASGSYDCTVKLWRVAK
jgi:hypothetical protein